MDFMQLLIADFIYFLIENCCLWKKFIFRESGYVSHVDEKIRRRLLFGLVTTAMFPTLSSSGKTKSKNPYDEKRLLEQNKRIQKENNAPEDFPSFVREGLCHAVVAKALLFFLSLGV